MKPLTKITIRCLLIFLFLELLFWAVLHLVEQHTRSNYLENRGRFVQSSADVVVERFNAVSHLVAHLTVQQPDMLKLVERAAIGDKGEREQVRLILKARLQPIYNLLRVENPMMMHLFLPDGTSLLRMHRPNDWNDYLFTERKITKVSLEQRKELHDYESGPYSFGAYRFLFPLEKDDRLLGGVELSLDHQTLISFLNENQPDNRWFMLVNNQQALSAASGKAGKISDISISDYRIILPKGAASVSKKTVDLLTWLDKQPELSAKLQGGGMFNIPVDAGFGTSLVATFLPVKNQAGQLMAYNLMIGKAPMLKQLGRTNSFLFPVGTLLLIGIVLLLHRQSVIKSRLMEEQETLSAITQGMGEGLIVQDLTGRLIYLNQEGERLLGYGRDDFAGVTVHERLHGGGGAAEDDPGKMVLAGACYRNEHEEYLTADGAALPVSVNATPLVKGGAVAGVVMLFSDIRAKLAAERQIAVTNQLYAALSAVNHVVVQARTNDGLFKEICRIAVEIAGFTAAYIGKLDEDGEGLQVVAAAGDKVAVNADETVVDFNNGAICAFAATQIKKAACIKCDLCLIDKLKEGGQIRLDQEGLLTAAYPLLCDGKVVAIIVFCSDSIEAFGEKQQSLLDEIVRDASFALDNLMREEEHYHAIGELHRISNFDSLTTLPNRTLFADRLEQAIIKGSKDNASLSVALFGLSRFKEINNSLGHGIGDLVLREISRRLKMLLPSGCTLARPGGDEFLLLMPDIDMNNASRLVAGLLASVASHPVDIPGQPLSVSIRAGITVWPDDGADAATLLKNVYTAMERVDLSEGNSYQFFSPGMTESSLERVLLENDLRAALREQQFVIYYQPKVDCISGKVKGCEALVRWFHPVKGLVGPDRFIPLLEESGMIGELGGWVLYEACRQLVEWQEKGLPSLEMAVNLSPLQIKSHDLLPEVRQVLDSTGLEPHRLELEITESAAMHDPERTISVIRLLKDMGIKIAIDDFGTGYSSLAQLKRLAANTLKIDRSFVRELPENKEDLAIAEAILSLAATLGMEVVAEGVETAEQAEFLKQKSCTLLQGYFFARPLPADQFEAFVRAGAAG